MQMPRRFSLGLIKYYVDKAFRYEQTYVRVPLKCPFLKVDLLMRKKIDHFSKRDFPIQPVIVAL